MNNTDYEKIDNLLNGLKSKGPLYHMNSEEISYIMELVNNNRPKLNTIYAISLNNIESLECVYNQTDFEKGFQHTFIPIKPSYLKQLDNYNKDIKESTTLIKYIGEGKFIEVYTNKTINLIDGKHIFNSKKDYLDFTYNDYKEEFNKYLRSPLFIDFKDCNELNKINTNRFSRNNKNKVKITSYINDLEKTSQRNLLDSLRIIIKKDYNYAILENNIRKLKI